MPYVSRIYVVRNRELTRISANFKGDGMNVWLSVKAQHAVRYHRLFFQGSFHSRRFALIRGSKAAFRFSAD
jgi:hypothetical protein